MASRRKDAGMSLEGSEEDANFAVMSVRTPSDNAPNRVQVGRGSDSVDGARNERTGSWRAEQYGQGFRRRMEWLMEICAA